MNDPGVERADAQHPWIGLASFTEGDRSFFAGRYQNCGAKDGGSE